MAAQNRPTSSTSFQDWRQQVENVLHRDFLLSLAELGGWAKQEMLESGFKRRDSPEAFVKNELERAIQFAYGSNWVDELRPGYFKK